MNPAQDETAGAPATPVAPSPATPARVLVVDDSGTVRLLLAQHVTRLGHRVVGARNGREALERLAAEPFDLVLLDVMMPELDGYAVLEAMKAAPELRHVPVVVVSGVEELSSVVRCIERGAEDYLPKPFNPTLLRARITACLEKKRLWDERQENYRRLQELERLKESLTGMVVHDLRTPLTSLIAGLRGLDALGDLNAEQREFCDIALQDAETLLQMINDLLDISRMEEGVLSLEWEAVLPRRLAEQAVRQVEYLARERGLRISLAVPDDLPPFAADAEKLCRTLVNLLGNAIKFTPGEGQVTLSAGSVEAEPGVRFTVSDTGEGIPGEALERIFDKFAQVESRRGGRTQSTGLGLTFCKLVVQAHGGRLWAESELGRGSSFHFTIPTASEDRPGA